MSGYAGFELSREFGATSRRTRKCTAVSVGLHVLLLLWFVLLRPAGPEETITEVTWFEAVETTPAAPVVLARSDPAPQEAAQPPSPEKQQEFFEREEPVAEIAPEPQRAREVEDKIADRLASLQRAEAESPTRIAALAAPSQAGRPILAGASDDHRPAPRAELPRDGSPGHAPAALTREPRRIGRAEIVASPLPEPPVERAAPKETETAARRVLAGAQLMGPVADRPVVHYDVPDYPDWAKREAVEGSVTIYFVVVPDGRVKENVMVQKTAGFDDFDENAVRALLAWRFEPLRAGATGEQWGTITFHYRLADVN